MAGMKETYKAIFGEEHKKEPYKMVAHSFVFSSRMGKSLCSRCGLVLLRNEFTEWSIKMGCLSSEHPQYEQVRKRFSRFKI